jgi:undecaprenyl-diphosphatase
MLRDRLVKFGHRMSWLSRVDSRLLLILLVLAPASAAFIEIASEVGEDDALEFDRGVLRSLRSGPDLAEPIGPGWLTEAVVEITALGGTAILTLVTALAALYLLARQKVALALFLAGAISAGAIFNSVLKAAFLRDRPDLVPHLVEVSSASFPSGHAMNSAMVYLTLAALLISAERSWRVRIFLILAALLLVGMVGVSRVYLGVHWPTDVLAGWSIGAAWAVLCSLVAHRLQQAKHLEGDESEDTLRGQ